MRPVRLAELRSLISQPEFQDWWGQLRTTLEALSKAQARWQQSLKDTAISEFNAELAQKNAIDTLYQAGESEDLAAAMSSEAADAENAAFQLVAQYEDLRIHVSEAWYRLGAMEKSADERQEALRNAGSTGKKAEEAMRSALRAVDSARQEYERQDARKRELWEKVEVAWGRQAEAALKMSEAKIRGKKVRADAEARFEDAESLKAGSERAKVDSERAANEVSALKGQVSRLMRDAAGRFG